LCGLWSNLIFFFSHRYNSKGEAREFGTHVYRQDILQQASMRRWQPAQYFNFSLSPPLKDIPFPSFIPPHITLNRVYADFFVYLYNGVRESFSQRYGAEAWTTAEKTRNLDFVIASPDRWHGNEQEFLRRVMVEANLVRRGDASSKVHFVPKREAIKHFVMKKLMEANLRVRLFTF
jgi:hypothetical protein